MGPISSGTDNGSGDSKPIQEKEYDEEDVYQDIDDVSYGYEHPSNIEDVANNRYEALEGTSAVYMNTNYMK